MCGVEIDMSSFRVVAKSMYLVLRKWINLLLHPSKIGKLYFSYIEIPVTTNCTLRCENCANLMQYYEPQPFIDAKTILSDIDKLLQSVGIIDTFGVLGGEPLLYPNLFEVMEKLINSDQIRAVRLVTNGTLFPNDQLISLLKNKKVTVMLSDYGSLSKEKKYQ